MTDNKSDSPLMDFIELDPTFLLSILKRYIIYLIIFALLISSLVLIYSLNLDKKYKSQAKVVIERDESCLLYTSPSPRDRTRSRMPSSA